MSSSSGKKGLVTVPHGGRDTSLTDSEVTHATVRKELLIQLTSEWSNYPFSLSELVFEPNSSPLENEALVIYVRLNERFDPVPIRIESSRGDTRQHRQLACDGDRLRLSMGLSKRLCTPCILTNSTGGIVHWTYF